MTALHRLARLLAPAVLAVSALTPAAGDAQIASTVGAPAQTLVVAKDKSAAFKTVYPVGGVVVAQPDVLELVATSDQSFYVRGKALGVTNLLIYDKHHQLQQVVDVRVGYDTDSLQRDLRTALPHEHIGASNFAGGILLSGEASTMMAAQRAQEIAERYAPKNVTSDIKVDNDDQILVEVRVLEASRSALKELGVNINAVQPGGFHIATGTGALASNNAPQATIGWTGHIGAVAFDANLQALEQKGLIRTLARPNLIAMSGQEASFLAGGEFPYPVPSGLNQTSIEFKPFGVKLNVVPELEPNGQIRLKVAPEVSELDPRNHLQINGFNMPALITRKAATTVALRDGQSFAIAGLFQQNYSNAINQIPWASDVPILGGLFRSTSWQRGETELVIVVTPHLTAPKAGPDQIPTPLASPREANAAEMAITGQSMDRPLVKPVGAPPPAKEIP
jgi:pilus assembly protein CpaC